MQGFSLKGGENFNISDSYEADEDASHEKAGWAYHGKGRKQGQSWISVRPGNTSSRLCVCVCLFIFTQALTTAWLYSKDSSRIPLADNQSQS